MAFRNFTVSGTIRSLFQPYKAFDNNATPADEDLPAKEVTFIEGMEVQIWHKSATKVTKLGQGVTASDGDFEINFSDNIIADSGGEINNVFLLVFYNGELVSQYRQDTGGFVDVLVSL